ncbi:hypothetical protein STEG23_028505, partial [Scotinomys teguina]
MDASVVYADLNLTKTREPLRASPLSLPPDTCRCPRWHRLALKLGCAGLILLVLGVIGLGVLVLSPLHKTSVEKSGVDVQENNRMKTTGDRDADVPFKRSDLWKEAKTAEKQWIQSGVWVAFAGLCTCRKLQSPDPHPTQHAVTLLGCGTLIEAFVLGWHQKPMVKGFGERTDSGLDGTYKILDPALEDLSNKVFTFTAMTVKPDQLLISTLPPNPAPGFSSGQSFSPGRCHR